MSERWRQVERIYSAVVARPESDWSTALADLCGGDDSLRKEVESLLAHETAASRFLESPAFAGAGVASDFARERALVGRRFGTYTVLAPIGAGGMGEVYRARDEKLGRQVAIKLLPSHFASNPDRRARLEFGIVHGDGSLAAMPDDGGAAFGVDVDDVDQERRLPRSLLHDQ